jgi:hypothetical protein
VTTTGLLVDVLREPLSALEAPLGPAGFAAKKPAQYTLPLVTARRIGGPVLDLRGIDQPIVTVDAYADQDKVAEQLCQRAIDELVNAWRRQQVYANGHIQRVEVSTGPVLVPAQGAPTGESHANATLQLRVRPAAGASTITW